MQFRFLADPEGKFVKALDLDFDATGPFGNHRSKRFALKIQDGKVKEVHVEPDNTGVNGQSIVSLHAFLTDIEQLPRLRKSWDSGCRATSKEKVPRISKE